MFLIYPHVHVPTPHTYMCDIKYLKVSYIVKLFEGELYSKYILLR